MRRPFKLVLSLAVSFAAAGIGSLVTTGSINGWYADLQKPSFNPPNELFGPVWTVLYLLMGISLYLVWSRKEDNNNHRYAYIAYGAQLILNVAWSVVFFGVHQAGWAILVIEGLLLAILMTIKFFWPISRLAALLLVPYVAWVCFAALLNISIAVLN